MREMDKIPKNALSIPANVDPIALADEIKKDMSKILSERLKILEELEFS